MNNKDNDLIYEAYLAEKVTELTDKHLADIRAKFYPNEGTASWDYVSAALRASFEKDLMKNRRPQDRLAPNADPTGEMDYDQWNAIADHLSELKYGSMGSLMNRGTNWLKNTGAEISRAAKRTRNKLKSMGSKNNGDVYYETYDNIEDIPDDRHEQLLALQKKMYQPQLNESVHQRGVIDAYNTSQQMKRIYERYYHNMIDSHGGDKAATSYIGLSPQQDDSEALQFLNVLNYLIDTMTPEKQELLSAVLANPNEHADLAYELSEMSSDELIGLTDGGSLPF